VPGFGQAEVRDVSADGAPHDLARVEVDAGRDVQAQLGPAAVIDGLDHQTVEASTSGRPVPKTASMMQSHSARLFPRFLSRGDLGDRMGILAMMSR
jgi:hypothetical protein